MLVFAGLLLGLVFLLGGTSGAMNHFRLGMQSMRINRRGTNVEAEILRSQPIGAVGGDTPSAVLIAGQWQWGGERFNGEFTVPGDWWDERHGSSIAVRIDPNRPHIAEVKGESQSPVWPLVLSAVWLIMAVVGAFFLYRSGAVACDPVQFDILEPVCLWVRG